MISPRLDTETTFRRKETNEDNRLNLMKQKIRCGKLSEAMKIASSHGVVEINHDNLTLLTTRTIRHYEKKKTRHLSCFFFIPK
jgi:hypothetical protein